MSPTTPDAAARAVCSRYPPFCREGTRTALGNRGGFSGAALWRIDGPAGALCLRAWPPHETWPRLHFRHRLMTLARRHRLTFVPALLPALDGATGVEHAGRLWELTEWLPGRADFHDRPSVPRLEAACTALARLHAAWRDLAGDDAPCPAVARRLRLLDDWRRLIASGWRPLPAADDPLLPLAENAWRRLPAALEALPHRLARWSNIRTYVQPCLCDLWHDHLLFDGDRLTGLIDFGAAKMDHVAVDLARMLGSLVRDDADGWRTGLRAYREVAPLTDEEEQLARALDETGAVLGVVNWLRWLYEEKRPFEDRAAVARRLAELLCRLRPGDSR